MKVFAALIVLMMFAGVVAVGQRSAGAGLPAFDVASVRPSKAGSESHSNVPLDSGFVYGSMSADDAKAAAGGYVVMTHQALWRYIAFAYKLSGTQEMALRFSIFAGVPKSGGPFWVTGSFDSQPEYFDISARAPDGTSTEQMRLMMQALLADRFHLAVHYQTADAPVFALRLVKAGVTGPHLAAHPGSDVCAAATDGGSPAQSVVSAVGDVPPVCGVIAHVPSSAAGQHFGGRAVTLAQLATTVPTMTGLAATPRPVVDETGLAGAYDFNLNWVHDASGDQAIGDNISSFREALKTQLGLEMKPSHAPLAFMIIDHVERPSEN